MQIFYFQIFYLQYSYFQAQVKKKKNGSHSEENSKALKIGPIYRDQFVSLHYFSVQLSSTREASEGLE